MNDEMKPDRANLPAPDPDEANRDPVDPGGATLANDTPTRAESSPLTGDLAGTAAELPHDVPSSDFVVATSDGHAPPCPHPTLPGYEILGELGRGGMGVVYQARQIRLNRAVALKMILAGQHAGAEAAARFLAEAEAVAKLQHPNIVQIFHIDEHAGCPYFEMEFVGGGSLAAQLDGAPRPPRAAARLVETLSRAMAEAHRHGVVHRDLKPGNILLTHEGVPKVADFGLAKLLNVESGLTRTDSVLGSPSYMAPEQAEGKTKDVGPAADIYALGTILYELLTGRPPFRGATVLETLEQVKTAEPVPPTRLVPGLPRDAETIALKCLQKGPAKRYESAAALAEDLRRYRAGEPIVARPVGAKERAWRWCRRNPALAALAAAVVTVALGATIAAFRFRALSQALQSNLYFSNIALADHELSVDNLGRALKLLDDCPQGLRQWEWSYLERLCRLDPVVFRADAEVNSVACSPDGDRLASAGGGRLIKVLNSKTGAVIQTLNSNTDYVYSVAFHRGGNHVAAACADRQVKVWDLTTAKVVFARPGSQGEPYQNAYVVAFSPDGRCVAAGSEGVLNVWDWRNDQLLHTLPGHPNFRAFAVAFSPDGRRLASESDALTVKIRDAETGADLRTLTGHRFRVTAIAFSPDGRRLATASFDRTVRLWDMASGLPLAVVIRHDGIVNGVAFSPDGMRLASVGDGKTVRVWDASTGREVLDLRGHTDMILSVAYSPDGRRIASAGRDATIRLWDATPLQQSERQEVHTFSQVGGEVSATEGGAVMTLAISPDGQRVASASEDTHVKVWDLRSGLGCVEFSGTQSVVFSLAWHTDGRRFCSSGVERGKGYIVSVWDAPTSLEAFRLPAGRETFAVAFSPDGRYLVTGGANQTVQVWDAQVSRKIGELGAHDRKIQGLAFSRDGRHLASASGDGTVKLWDWDATRLGEKQEAHRVIRARAPERGFILAFSPDGRRLVAGGEENTVKIWDVQTGRELRSLPGHHGDVWATAFSPDPEGRWVASAGEDSTVKVWNSHAGTLVRSYRGHTGTVTTVAFSPDGQFLVSGSRDGTVKVWDLTTLRKKPEE
jgi:WD40 repeat protein/tRNA A-37 threonylcarbamoyl transferase component Bud32